MKYFDLHCDTLSKALHHGFCKLAINPLKPFDEISHTQIFAVWIDDKCENPLEELYHQLALFKKLDIKQAILSVENGIVLEGKLERISELQKAGIRMLTLTWNADNCIASGVCGSGGGLTDFGRSAVSELERVGIIIDVSHLNERSFWGVCERAKRPFVASHSNAQAVCGHPRNLTDSQIAAISDCGGIIGLNFYKKFLTDLELGRNSFKPMLMLHASHILERGGENVLALGSDFDGADMPPFIRNVEKIPELFEDFVKEFGEKIAKKIFYENAESFFSAYSAQNK